MVDPFRGELTARYVHQDNLDWAESERLARQAKPAASERKSGWLGLKTHLGWPLNRLLRRHHRPPALMRPHMAH
jgi:hypothetical protein